MQIGQGESLVHFLCPALATRPSQAVVVVKRVLQTKVNSRNEKSPAKFARLKKGKLNAICHLQAVQGRCPLWSCEPESYPSLMGIRGHYFLRGQAALLCSQ